MPRTVAAFAILIAFSFAGVHAEDSPEGEDYIRTSAIPKKRTPPSYPTNELASRKHGWVILSYVVGKNGKVIDPIVVQSSGTRAFERSALRAARRFIYEPATVNGEPVEQSNTQARIIFTLGTKPGAVTRRFKKRYERIADAIGSGDLTAAAELLDETEETFDLTLAETSWLWSLRARLAGISGDKDAQLVAVRRATTHADWVSEQLYPNLLTVRATLEVQKGLFADALESFSLLEETGVQNSSFDTLARVVERIENVAASPQVIRVEADIESLDDCVDCRPNWQYRPLRSQFALSNVRGALHEIELRCEWSRSAIRFAPELSWSLPDDAGDCSIVIFGEPGTQFDLLELPSA